MRGAVQCAARPQQPSSQPIRLLSILHPSCKSTPHNSPFTPTHPPTCVTVFSASEAMSRGCGCGSNTIFTLLSAAKAGVTVGVGWEGEEAWP